NPPKSASPDAPQNRGNYPALGLTGSSRRNRNCPTCKRLAYLPQYDRKAGLRRLRSRPPPNPAAQRREHRKRDEKLAQRREPYPMPRPGAIVSQHKHQQPRDAGKYGRLPQVISDRKHAYLPPSANLLHTWSSTQPDVAQALLPAWSFFILM